MKKKALLDYLSLFAIFIISVLLAEPSRSQEQTLGSEKIISAGITVVEEATLRMEPNSDSKVIKKLEFGIPFFILEKRHFIEGRRGYYWYKAMLTDRETIGWIIGNEGREGFDPELKDIEKGDFAGLYYSVSNNSLWGYKDYDAAEKLFRYVLENYADRQIPVHEPGSGLTYQVNGKIGALEGLAELYKAKGEYQRSLEHYEKITGQKETKRQDIVNARRNIMLTYKENIKDREKTVELCHNIIREFPNEEILGFEWNTWVDIEAAAVIVKTYSIEIKDLDKLMQESQKIISETSNPPAILTATRGIVISQIVSDKHELAKATMLEAMKRYPKEIRVYGDKYPVNYTVGLLSSAIETIVVEHGDYAQAIELAKSVRDSIQEEEVNDFTDFKVAQLLDEGSGDRKEVLTAYEKVKSALYWNPITGRKMWSWDIKKRRIGQIKVHEVEEVVVSEENVVLKPGLRSKPQSYKSIPKGSQIKIIYKDKEIMTINEKVGSWAKVKLAAGTVGWIFDGFLSPVLKRPLFSPLEDKEEIWSMEGANSNRTSAIMGKVIKKPALVKVFPDISSREVIFSDVNDDRILDIFAYASEGLVAIDGTTHKIIWLFNCSYGSIPVVRQGVIYLIANVKDEEYLYALDKRTGEPIWRVLVNKRGHSPESTSSPAIDDDFIYVGTFDGDLLAIDIKEEKIKWKFSTSYPMVGSVTKVNNLLYFASRESFQGNDKLFALDTFNGKLIWKFDFQSENNSGYVPAVCVEDGVLFCNGSNGYLYALEAKTGNLVWRQWIGGESGPSWSKPSVFQGVVYCGTNKNEIYAVASKTGDVRWKYAYSQPLWGTPAVIDEELYIRSIDGYLHAVSLSEGLLLWKIKIGDGAYGGIYSPSIAQGLVFSGSTDGNLYVIGENTNPK